MSSQKSTGSQPARLRVLVVVTLVVVGSVLAAAATAEAQAQFDVLHAFFSASSAGPINPSTSLIQATDGNFYGTTASGGPSNLGTVFQMTPAGTVTVLHAFAGGPDGANPRGALIQASDGNFYGTTQAGGLSNLGTVFRMTPSGILTVLHAFAGGPDTAEPLGALVQGTDGNFYGTTSSAVFRMTPSGIVTVLHQFVGFILPPVRPFSLIQGADGNFYGISTCIRAVTNATIFKISPDGSFTVVHEFPQYIGCIQPGSLIQGTDGNFYGTLGNSLFRMAPDGDITPAADFGYPIFPNTLMQASDGSFYGTTNSPNAGAIFRFIPGASILHTFEGGTDGADPRAALIQARDGNFYGTTYAGGSSNLGTAFQMTRLGKVTILHEFAAVRDGSHPKAALLQATDGNLYGTTHDGGAFDLGTVFRMKPSGIVTLLHAFAGGMDGANPDAALIQASDGNFYGTTASGGSPGDGTIFKMTPDGTLTVLHMFNFLTDGVAPSALIEATDGNFYGTTRSVAFKMTPDGTFAVLHTFSPLTEGFDPSALIQAADGNFYGTARSGGPSQWGTVFKMTPSGTVTVLYAFTDGTDGAYPRAALVQASDGNFYGTTTLSGGLWGTAFRVTPSGNFTILHSFPAFVADGLTPEGALLEATDGTFYGTSSGGGQHGFGTIFQMTPAGEITVLHSFAGGTDGARPEVGVIQASDGNLYGTTPEGGLSSLGVVFRLGNATGPLPVDLTITKTHSGNVTQGQTGMTYSIGVTNIGVAPTTGTVSVGDTLPSGLSATGLSGPGWNCTLDALACTRTDALPPGASYPAITLTANVSSSAPASVINVATVAGGGDADPTNNTAADPTGIQSAPLTAPSHLVATATTMSQITLTWDAVADTAGYQVFRSANGSPYWYQGSPAATAFIDTNVSGGTTYLYEVRSTGPAGIGPMSRVDLATTIVFIDEPVVSGATGLKAEHVVELQVAVNDVRAAAGLAPAVFTHRPASGDGVNARNILELRAALDAARAALGLDPVAYTDPALGPGDLIKAAHIQELRAGVK